MSTMDKPSEETKVEIVQDSKSDEKKSTEEKKSIDETKAVVKKETSKETDPSLGSPEAYIKHPLQCRWALWFFKNDRTKDWKDNLRLVTKFDTVEDFWAAGTLGLFFRYAAVDLNHLQKDLLLEYIAGLSEQATWLYNHIQLSSRLQSGCDYNLFKDGIQPMWEDDANKKGGKWMLQLNKQQRQSDLDKVWLETLLVLIGEGFGEDSDYVNGGVVQIRNKGDKASIWTSDCKNKASVMHIGEVYKQRLGLPKKITLGFQAHEDTMSKTGSTVKSKYVV